MRIVVCFVRLANRDTGEKLRPARKPAVAVEEPCITRHHSEVSIIMVAFTRKNTPEVAEADRRGFAKFRFGAEWPNDFTKEATYIRGVRSSLGQKERKEARICCVFISVSEQNRSVGLPSPPEKI